MLVGTLLNDTISRTNILLRMTNSTTNQASGGQASLGSAIKPTTVSDYMLFDGTKNIRFSDTSNNWHVTAPYSIELDCYLEDNDGAWIGTSGEGYGAGWPEWNIIQSSGKIAFNSSSDNQGYTTTANLVLAYNIKQWYRLGLMFYNNTGTRMKGLVNDTVVFDIPCAAPYDAANGLAFGSDVVYTGQGSIPGATARVFKGRIRNVTIARSLFWPI